MGFFGFATKTRSAKRKTALFASAVFLFIAVGFVAFGGIGGTFGGGALGPSAALAQAPDLGLNQVGTAIGLTTTDVRTVAANIIRAFMGLLGIIALGIVLYAGFLWMTANGDEEKVTRAKRMLTQGIIGLVIIMSAFAITQFIIGAIQQGTGLTTQGCPPGQICNAGGGGGFGGGAGAFRVDGVMPAGSGPGDSGWPKNYSITVAFNAQVAADSVTPSSLEVRKCNARLAGGTPSGFNSAACGAAVAGTLVTDGNRVRFQPSGTAGGNPTDFEADFWYKVRLQGGGVRDTAGRTLLCPFQTVDISTSGAGNDYCERAMAFNDIRDVLPPTVAVTAPSSPPAYCASTVTRTAQVIGTATDDFMVANIDFLLDGGASGLVDAGGAPFASAANTAFNSPFRSESIFVDLFGLAPGAHKITAKAQDGVPLTSSTAEREFTVNPASCCNAIQDEGETGLDCGGMCGSCNGGSCTTGAECASGLCTAGKCADRPVIQSVSPLHGGVGTLVTVSGAGFGTTPGGIAFLGADTDGNGDPEGDADDVAASACAPQAWGATQVAVAVPTGAVSGPIKLITAAGIADRTDDDFGPGLGSFAVGGAVIPGVCYLSPSEGTAGTKVAINGAGFGDSPEQGRAFLGSTGLTLVSCNQGDTDCGWSDSKIWVTAPPIADNVYQTKVVVAGNESNTRTFALRGPTTATPHVDSVIPEHGPVGSYVTITGSGFGTIKGTVRFGSGPDTAVAEDPVCADNWHDNYIIVKVPKEYAGGLPLNVSADGAAHTISVITAPPSRTSNADVTFGVTDGDAAPGVCSISPDNGPAGTVVVVSGEGFGNGPGSATATPHNFVEFFNKVIATGYSSWSGSQIGTVVPGSSATGPVHVTANNQISANAVPFTIRDCRTAGAAACGNGLTCCANGSCQASCEPVSRDSAYGWRFSTNVLPTLPTVVERASCDVTAVPAQPQSPSPAKGSTDACRNTTMYFEFSRPLDTATFNSTTVKVEECGSGDQADCAAGTVVPMAPFSVAAGTFSGCDSLNGDRCAGFQGRPADAYNDGSHFLKRNTWYRVTLVSNPGANVGLREAGADGRYLDGDKDRRQGGDYVSTFRVRDSDDPCQLANVMVLPPSATISQDQDPMQFSAGITAGNCNLLQCGAGQPYAIAWSGSASYLRLLTANADACVQPVLAVADTSPGRPTPLTATVTPTPVGSAPPKSGSSQVTVKFADPRVISVTPIASCTAACINAAISAEFNIPMDPGSLNGNTVELLRCRNSSCTAPFASDLGVSASVVAEPADGVASNGLTVLHRHVSIRLSGNLAPNTFYLARIRGGATGALSRSGVPLTGMNDGDYFSWKFRTKNDDSACSVARATLTPSAVTLRYVGQRAGFAATPFGSPDECSTGGQQLSPASYNWNWNLAAPNPVVQGFVDGAAPFSPLTSLASPASVVDTAAQPRTGCSANCLPTGSQTALPQCGNGVVESKFEECDDGNTNDGDACTNRCVFRGNVAPACGDHVLSAADGETCEMLPDPSAPGSYVWPPGCKQPGVHVDGFADNIGCVFTGASADTKSVCGDGLVGDGEACDDGNTANGDGCSASCLQEGTLRSCAGVAPGQACINFCGNGIDEPGEDPSCDPNPAANGCDVHTCLKVGTAKCPANGSGTNCCGNGVVDAGEDASCETDPDRAEFCTNRCLLKGSSGFYTQPSFCGDGIVGKGEKASCEPSDSVENPAKIDPFQVIAGRPQAGFDASSPAGSTSTVQASVDGMPAANAGTASVNLACNCKNEPAGSQDAYCSGINPPGTNNLACADNGCCTPRPTIITSAPTQYDSCRNAEIRLTFSEPMNQATLEQNLLVGYNNGTADCPQGSTVIPPTAFEDGNPGLLHRLWNGLVAFVRNYVIRPALGNPPTPPNAGEQAQRYCSVDGVVTVTLDGPPGSQHTVLTFSPRRALPANKYVRIRLNPGVKSAGGTPIDGNGYVSYFGTSGTICAIQKVSITPPSVLLTTASSGQTVVAHGLSATDQPIVPTLDYAWDWSWEVPPTSSAVVIAPHTTNLTQCSLGATCSVAAGCPCIINATTCTVANGAASCNVTTLASTSTAEVRVRGAQATDAPDGVKPHNSNGPVPVEARANLKTPSGVAYAISSTVTTDTGRATVLLCNLPWPKYQSCVNGKIDLPWLAGTNYCDTHDCSCTADTWFPFFDPDTNEEFYYCRDAAPPTAEQPSVAAAAPLPCLRETPARVLSPAPGILREHLFTFATSGCQGAPTSGGWSDDAIGLRVAQNSSHMSSAQWFANQGFAGAPTPVTIDGYQGVQEGRTVYVNAAAKTDNGSLYTNVNVLSYSDGADEATTAIFGQILNFVDFNRNPELTDMGICRVGDSRNSDAVHCNADADCRVDSNGAPVAGRDAYSCDVPTGRCKNGDTVLPYAGNTVSCSADVDCQVDGNGKPVVARAGVFFCDAPKSKLVRDVRRWSDLQTLRTQLITRKQAVGSYPTIDAGSFLRGETVSAWPSWTDVLGKELAVTIPTDPLNRHGAAIDRSVNPNVVNNKFDPVTGWNSQALTYMCPADSHVYEYRSIGGTDFQLRSDFEYASVNAGGTDVWRGDTCVERTTAACNPTNDPNGMCKKTCNAASTNAGSSCVTDSDCAGTGSACAGPCNYAEGKIFASAGTSPLPSAWCSGQTVGVGGVCGDGILSPGEQCEVGQRRSLSCDSDPGAAIRSGAATQICGNTCQWANAGACSSNSANAGATCVINSDCQGTNARCINWTGTTAATQDFRCVGGATNPPCTSNASCGAGQTCVGACTGGTCGDGIRQSPPEACDDGALNGTYGHCNATCTAAGLSCGDGKKQPGEACDCKDQNGQYAFNGVLASASQYGVASGDPVCRATDTTSASCAWDCKSAGPRCGDNVVNGGEQCDGGSQQFKGVCGAAGALNNPNSVGCNTNADCPSGSTCGNFCATPEQQRRRECNPNQTGNDADDEIACTWGTWVCTAPGSCGNGIKETGEQCDDGNTNNGDACVIDPSNVSDKRCVGGSKAGIACTANSQCTGGLCLAVGYMCKTASCGDGYVNPAGGEECDDGSGNGRLCSPEYGLTCNYCSGSCRVATVTGGFCGDGLVQDLSWNPPPPTAKAEQCDGTVGLSANWVCVGNTAPYLPYGKIFAPAICGASSCQRTCASPEASVCLMSGVDTDGDGITDNCDTDDDNDGVPDAANDCRPTDPTIHPAYVYTDKQGNVQTVEAAAEYCDGQDNDCDGTPDDDFVVDAKPGEPGLTFQGDAVDAFFPDKVDISGAQITVTKGLCSGDKVTQCSWDGDCVGIGDGHCGIPAMTVPVNGGKFAMTTPLVRSSAQASCPLFIQVEPYTPASDLNIPYLTASPDELEERVERGYYAQTLQLDSATGTQFFDGGAGHNERILLFPVPRKGRAMAAITWVGDLGGNYLDAYLKIQGKERASPNDDLDGDKTLDPSILNYTNQNLHRMDKEPYSRLICDSTSSGGDPTSCQSFGTSPEIFLFDTDAPLFNSPGDVDGHGYLFYVHNFNCRPGGSNCNPNVFRDKNVRAYFASNPSNDAGGGNGRVYGPYLPPDNPLQYWVINGWWDYRYRPARTGPDDFYGYDGRAFRMEDGNGATIGWSNTAP